ncbi:hypothetical protein CDAR_300161 [Caerostris darwini]|uniref:Uncharacterized protein n=1 Tax=Caerostris darwini TaxID=1538125 RepID=A0AAV4W5J8_9ARAC|nr:hypothetical protein CDAR_300161 [Caerostris darwini]
MQRSSAPNDFIWKSQKTHSGDFWETRQLGHRNVSSFHLKRRISLIAPSRVLGPVSNQKTPPKLQRSSAPNDFIPKSQKTNSRDFRETRQSGHRNASRFHFERRISLIAPPHVLGPVSNQKTPPKLQRSSAPNDFIEIPEDKFRDFRETRQSGHRNASRFHFERRISLIAPPHVLGCVSCER